VTQELNYVIFNSGAGWIGILSSANGLLTATLPQPSKEEAHRLLDSAVKKASRSPLHFSDLEERFREYFCGHAVTFPDKLDLSLFTPFQRRVWEVTGLIPYGETRSYTWVAEQVGKPKAVRAVGQALGRNPLPVIIPCHRVVTIEGKLGGYSGGLEFKQYLLSLEVAGGLKKS
jgi:methylated-DNA-[protein]-cysteine S-methyltransferase